MYIGMRGHDFDTNTLDALCEKCKEYGVGGVQLVLLRSLADFKKGNFTPEYAKSIGDKLRENGIRVPILGCYINPSDANEESLNESLDYFIENLHYAKYIGAEMVGLETCRFSDDDEINNSEETYQYLLKNMKKLVSAAEEIGVNVGIEGVHFHVINTPTKMKRLVDDLNSPNVRVIFDPVNPDDPDDDIYYVLSQTFNVSNDWNFAMPRSGAMITAKRFIPIACGMVVLMGATCVVFFKKKKKRI